MSNAKSIPPPSGWQGPGLTWPEALAAYEIADKAHSDACAAVNHRSVPADTLDAWKAALTALMATPAPDLAAVAYKVSVHPDGLDFRDPETAPYIERDGDQGERAFLAIYQDLMRLAQGEGR